MALFHLGGDTGGNPHPRFGSRGLGIALAAHYKRLFVDRQSALWLGILISCLLLVVVLPVRAQEAVTVIDADGNEITITDTSRVITVGGAVTEIAFALGAGDQIVARDASSLYPPEVETLDSVGYVRQLSAEPVLALDPTLIITTPDAGPPEALEQLRASGVTLLIVPHETSLEGVIATVETVATALSREAEGVAIIERINTDYAAAQTLLETVESRPRVMFIYARGAGAVSVAGTNTSAATMIELAGGENAVTEYEGYQPITAEAVVAAAPDVILMMTRGLKSIGGIDGLLEQPGIAQTPAGENRRIVAMDDLYLLGFSTRTGTAVLDLTTLLHEELTPTLITLLRADGRFNTLLTAVEAAGQTALLSGETPYTLFAPTDDAFAALPPGMLDGLMSSTISLQAVLSFHVLEGAVLAEDVIALDGQSVQTLYPDGRLAVAITEAGVTLNETVNVIETDHVAGNGVIHVIDAVLVPQRQR
jgi:iron complex transport system substrate-binding protein